MVFKLAGCIFKLFSKMQSNSITFFLSFCRSGIPDNPTVFYTLMKGSTEQTNKKDTFYLDQRNLNGDTWADIQVNYPLDYERIQQYNLTVRVEVRFHMSFLYM